MGSVRLLFLLICLPLLTLGLFEDQAGSYDWRQQYIGRPLYTKIDTNLNRLFIASEQNALACVNLKSGNIVWRKVFEIGEAGQIDHVIWALKEIVVVSNNGQRVQGFDYNRGFATWEYSLFGEQTQKQKILSVVSKKEKESYYLANNKHLCLVGSREKICIELPTDDGFVTANLFETDHGVFVIRFKDTTAQKLQYNTQLSSLLSKTILNDLESHKNLQCMNSLDSNYLSCYSDQISSIFTTEIKSGNANSLPLTIQKSILSSDREPRLAWSSKDFFLIETLSEDDGLNLYLFKKEQNENDLVLLKKIESVQAYDQVSHSQNSFLIYSKYIGKNKLNFYTFDLKKSQERTDLLISANVLNSEDILQLEASVTENKNSQLSVTVSCFFKDYSLSVFNQQGVKYFTREEALAYISTVEMVDFPLLHLQEEFEDEFGSTKQDNLITMFYKRIKTQLIMLKEFIQIDLVQKVTSLLQNSPMTKKSQSGISLDEITRDEFNLNKIIVAVTSIGKVFGIYTSANGKILWSFYLKNTIAFKFNKVRDENTIPFFVQRTAAHVPYEPQCVLISKANDQNGSLKTRVYFFNPLTGRASKDAPKEGYLVDYQVKQAFLSYQMDSHYLKPVVLFDTENRIHVFPQSSISDLQAKSSNKPTIIFSTQRENDNLNTLTGYSLSYSNEPLPEVWRLNFEDEKISAIASKLSNDRIHSHGKILGDRSVLYKYLNPNLVGVVTTGQDSQNVPYVNVYLVDTVTGSVVNSFNHKRCKGPVNIVHSENWFFYSYYNMKFRRHEVTSVELFEGDIQNNSTHFSSLDDIKPIVFSKSYIVQRSFDSMQVTLTEKGISTKDVIVACQYGVIMEIPWILIDPRRPIKMTEVEREENLLPYMPEIPLNYEFTLNYYNYVYNTRGISTAPSGLESTSLVFTYGLDIFFTRVFPSKTFDMIREDFDYFFITTLMVGLVLGTLLTKKLAAASNLKKAWK
ncbi:unnamed protein product [Brachionus calyciflorus]|uniref:ER membrane protein complex subunit 1 n=1 Tax=Brachionus calyciflorus TaxID=104777 RepID=A0A813MEK4_9BILA|nr:unnamed protein product [Brachionus calyciflorus]